MVILLRMTRFCPVSLFLKMTCSFINSGIRSVTHINLVVHVMLDSAALPCLLCCGTVGVIVLINHKHAVIVTPSFDRYRKQIQQPLGFMLIILSEAANQLLTVWQKENN